MPCVLALHSFLAAAGCRLQVVKLSDSRPLQKLGRRTTTTARCAARRLPLIISIHTGRARLHSSLYFCC